MAPHQRKANDQHVDSTFGHLDTLLPGSAPAGCVMLRKWPRVSSSLPFLDIHDTDEPSENLRVTTELPVAQPAAPYDDQESAFFAEYAAVFADEDAALEAEISDDYAEFQLLIA